MRILSARARGLISVALLVAAAPMPSARAADTAAVPGADRGPDAAAGQVSRATDRSGADKGAPRISLPADKAADSSKPSGRGECGRPVGRAQALGIK